MPIPFIPEHPPSSDGDYIVLNKPDDEFYVYPHLHPETDLIVRAICDKLGIDWPALRAEMEK